MAAKTEGSVTFPGYQILGARAGGSSLGHRGSPSSSQGRTVHTVSSPGPLAGFVCRHDAHCRPARPSSHRQVDGGSGRSWLKDRAASWR